MMEKKSWLGGPLPKVAAALGGAVALGVVCYRAVGAWMEKHVILSFNIGEED